MSLLKSTYQKLFILGLSILFIPWTSLTAAGSDGADGFARESESLSSDALSSERTALDEERIGRKKNSSRLYSSALQADQADLIFVTEDFADFIKGCDSISSFDGDSGRVLVRGDTHVSPGRLSIDPTTMRAMATTTNGEHSFLLALGPSDREQMGAWRTRRIEGADFATASGIEILNESRTVLVGLSRKLQGSFRGFAFLPNAAPFRLAKFELPTSLAASRLGALRQEVIVDDLVIEIVADESNEVAHVLLATWQLLTIDLDSMEEVAARVDVLPVVADSHPTHSARVDVTHANMTRDRNFLLINRANHNKITIVDLKKRTSDELVVSSSPAFVGEVATNHGWLNPNLIALHEGIAIAVYDFDRENGLVELGRIEVADPRARVKDPDGIYYTGPSHALSWNGDGSRLVAATDDGKAEFVVIDVTNEGQTLTKRHAITVCPESRNFPNDIVSMNGFITPPATSTPSPTITPSTTPVTPSPTPSSTPTQPSPTHTATDWPTNTPSPTASPQPADIYLPLLLREPKCDPALKPAEITLLIDASSSMQGAKLSAAKEAALAFVSEIDFAKDRVAVVAFNDGASLKVGLSGDKSEVEGAILDIQSSPGTRIDRGLEAGRDAFADARPSDVADRAIILLTDGRQSVLPEAPAQIAAEIRASGTQIFAIGLGADVDGPALLEIAGQANRLYLVPTPSQLAQIYRLIAAEIPCPPEMFWGGPGGGDL